MATQASAQPRTHHQPELGGPLEAGCGGLRGEVSVLYLSWMPSGVIGSKVENYCACET